MKVSKRRRRENKTDYLKRIKLLKSNIPRIVFRKTNKYLIAQYVESKDAQDKIKIGLNSRDLFKYGWPEKFKGSLKSIPASYLIGFLMAKKISKDKLKKPIIDFGMIRALHKTKIYGFVKGLIDGGIDISDKKDIFPEEDRIKGKNLKKDFSDEFEKIKLNIEKE